MHASKQMRKADAVVDAMLELQTESVFWKMVCIASAAEKNTPYSMDGREAIHMVRFAFGQTIVLLNDAGDGPLDRSEVVELYGEQQFLISITTSRISSSGFQLEVSRKV